MAECGGCLVGVCGCMTVCCGSGVALCGCVVAVCGGCVYGGFVWPSVNRRPLEASQLEALGGLMIGGPWRPYN
jgi:membrane associated rhomboid family serine protease